MKERKFDLQERFIDYSVEIVRLSEQLPETKAGRHICDQILRSGTSPAPNYGEAQSAESKADFIHKLKVALKELRETEIWLKMTFLIGNWIFRNTIRHILVFFARFSQNQLLSFCAAKS
jgi:four helix bundle protein